ncbi:hypothetical protein BIV24_08750 [Streptomyces colonosanans]|uniref:Uncharacterized protein n=1 Tax=Streptomyces colonosanans TaxID=1428652 RepID=A0A1S2PPM4_9ACTN|nr:hypothetical protein BIV24_08750 [Streptomyces colonosanans]
MWDAAETVAGEGSTDAEIRSALLVLIGDMLNRGITIGDMSPRDGEGVIPWNLSREQALRKVAAETGKYEDSLDYVKICWFSAA